MHVGVDKSKIEIDMSKDREWGESIGKTVYEICNDPARNRIKLNERHTGFIMESNDSTALSSIGWAIEKHLNEIPSKTKANISKNSVLGVELVLELHLVYSFQISSPDLVGSP
jgi:hypothetical protein